jgi:3'(2'), 5'-bisphosphate nucleotidase
LIEQVCDIAREAGKKILEIYNLDFEVEYKEDQSPLTLADKTAHKIIVKNLQQISDCPILSEEGKEIPYDIRKNWEYYWCVDPLDGTKEFIKKNGEFTVNIALIHNGAPVLGVVYAPVIDTIYYAKKGEGAYKETNRQETIEKIKLPIQKKRKEVVIVASKSHMNDETKEFIKKIINSYHLSTNDYRLINKGSSLKLCLVAEGIADIYPRIAPTMEWDTAAADAIVREVGKMTYIFDKDFKIDENLNASGNKLQYNKKNLLNPYFVVV